MKKWNYIGGLFFVAFSLSACTTVQPGNPAHSWLNGKWRGETGIGATVEANLRVENGNQVKGYSTYTRPDGRAYDSTISGFVREDKVELDVYYPSSGRTRKYRLMRQDRKVLYGSIDWTGGIRLQKAGTD